MIVLALAALLGNPQSAPVDDDWDLRSDPERQSIMALVNLGTAAVAVRCQTGSLDVLVSGLSVTDEQTRQVSVSLPGRDAEQQTWPSHADGVASTLPEPDRAARLMRVGGDFEFRIASPDADTPATRYRLPLPASPSAVAQVLAACGTPLQDPWDALPRASLVPGSAWSRRPAPDYPDAAMSNGIKAGEAQLRCLIGSAGRLEDCRTLREAPAGAGFAKAALASIKNGARVAETESLPPGHVVVFSIRFRLP